MNLATIGVTLGAQSAVDLCRGVATCGAHAGYIVIDARDVPAALRGGERFTVLVADVVSAAGRLPGGGPHVFVRAAPLTPAAATATGLEALAGGATGMVLTADGHDPDAHSRLVGLIGHVYRGTEGRLALIASGDFANGLQALEAVEAGASVVQISGQLLEEGPGACRRLKTELSKAMASAGHATLAEAVGVVHRQQPKARKKNPWRARKVEP